MKSTEIIQPTPISAPIAHAGLKFNIPENATGSELASIAEGFPAITMKALDDDGLPPRGQDCNGMFYLSTDQKVYLQNGGIITFNQSVSDLIGGYPQGAYLDYITSEGIYTKVKSLIEDNTYNFVTTPEYIDGEKWEQVNFGANQSLTNLTPEGETHFLGQRNISNNINSAPELVKWKLEDGVLTLLSGSIARWAAGTEAPTLNIGDLFHGMPIVDISWDGTNLVYYCNTLQDYAISYNGPVLDYANVFVEIVGETIQMIGIRNRDCQSGTTTPTSGNIVYYNTNANSCTRVQTNSICSFPLMKYWVNGNTSSTPSMNGITTVCEVYQTGGCIGSIIWLNKNVSLNCVKKIDSKCGLASIEHTTEYDFFIDLSGDFSRYNANIWFDVNLNNNGTGIYLSSVNEYNSAENYLYNYLSGNNAITYQDIVGTNLTVVNGQIQSYTPRMPFRAADAQDIDGRWIIQSKNLANNVALPKTAPIIYDVSSALPKDGKIYEVDITGYIDTANTANAYSALYIKTDLENYRSILCRIRNQVANQSNQSGGNLYVLVGANRQIIVDNHTSNTGTFSLEIKRFRRVR